MKISKLISTGFCSGNMPFASGSWGSLAALGLWFCLIAPLPSLGLELGLALIAASSLIGLYAIQQTVTDLNQVAEISAKGKIDPGFIVIDEWAGMFIALLGADPTNLYQLFAAFFFFRLFDVLKPGPIRKAERWGSPAFGILFDDILAGILALVIRIILFG